MFAARATIHRLSALSGPRPLGAARARLVFMGALLGAAVGTLPLAHAETLADIPGEVRACHLEKVAVSQHEVRIHTDCEPAFTALKFGEPARVVVDITGGDARALQGTLPIDDGLVRQITVQQMGSPQNGDARTVGRVSIDLEADDVAYEVMRDGHDIVVRTHAEAPGEAKPQGKTASRAFVPLQPAASPPADLALAAPRPEAVAAAAAAAAPAQAAAPVATPRAGRLVGLRQQDGGALLQLGTAAAFRTRLLQGPPRLVVDLPGSRARTPSPVLRGRPSWLAGVRLGRIPAGEPAGLRVVFDLRGDAVPEVQPRAEGLWVGLANRATAQGDAGQGPQAAATPKNQTGRLLALHAEHEVVQGKHQTRILLTTQGDVAASVEAHNPRAFILSLRGAQLPEQLEQSLDTRKQPGVVSLLSAFQASRDPAEVHVVASLGGRATQMLSRVPEGWVWQIDDLDPAGPTSPSASQGPSAAATQAAKVAQAQTAAQHGRASRAYPRTAGFVADVPRDNAALRNHRISLDVKDADIVNVLRLISEETGENIIASDEVKGKITLKLRNVPAELALDTVLRIKGFDRVRHNNILRIASAESIQKERDLEVARKKALIEVEEVGIKMVTVNYANAGEVVEQLKPMLSARGSLQVDQRTNTLILQDVTSNLDRLTELAQRLDKQTPLVNIQARIVEATSNFSRDLGVQWGGSSQHTARTGNPTGVYFPADVTASGAADLPTGNQAGGVVSPARYAVNFPALLSGQGAGLGFVLGSAGGAQLLDLRLSAMESNGNGKIISSPEVSTLDNKTARVSQGIEIPISTVSAAGTNTRFIPAVLQLEVTPHVTNDGTVLMKIHVEKSAPDPSIKGAAGDPAINKRQADTEVLVRDGDTSVIGGILTRETSELNSEVPFLARIPILGNLFRRRQSAENRAELLVFITPRIINREASTMQAGSVFDRSNN